MNTVHPVRLLPLLAVLVVSAPATAQVVPGEAGAPPPWSPPPACEVVERSAVSPLCAPADAACPLVDDVRIRCSGGDTSFRGTRGGGVVLFSHPVRSHPRRVAIVTPSGTELSGPIPWDGEAGHVHVDPSGRPHVFLYGLRPGGGVGYVRPDADGAWHVEQVDAGWPSLALSVAFEPDGAVSALLGHTVERGPAVASTRLAAGTWRNVRLAAPTVGWPAVATSGGRVLGAAFRIVPGRAEYVLDLFEDGRRVETLPSGPIQASGYPPVVRLAAADPDGAADAARPVALYPKGRDLVVTFPARGGPRTVALAPLYRQSRSTCRLPRSGGCGDGSTCETTVEGVVPYDTSLARDAAGRVVAAWLEARVVRTHSLTTRHYNAMPIDHRPPPREAVSCESAVMGQEFGNTLVLAEVGPRRVRERLRVAVGSASFLGVHREGEDLVVSMAEGSGVFRSVTVRRAGAGAGDGATPIEADVP